jgi:hypothetical protein
VAASITVAVDMDLPRTLRPVRRLKLLKDLILEKLDASLATPVKLKNTRCHGNTPDLRVGSKLSHRAGGLNQAEALSNDTRLASITTPLS